MSADDRKPNPLPQALLLAVVAILAAVSGVTALAQKVVEFGPQVGDLVAFDPARPAPVDSLARVTANRPRLASCVLDVAIIQRSGGSLVVEQRASGPDRFYRAHWAGARTSDDLGDCGTEADLVLSMIDINALATAAGGFGVNHVSVLLMR
jgi:hypothetical protein